MPKFTGIIFVLFLIAVPAMAQDAQQAPAPQQTPTAPPVPAPPATTWEISAGYTIHRFYQPDATVGETSPTMQGWYADVEHNIFKRWLGVEAQASAGYKNQGPGGKLSVYTVMAGPTLYPFGHRKFTLFGHILVGEGYYRNVIPNSAADFPGTTLSSTTFNWAGGAGLDIALSRRWALRLPMVEYASSDYFKTVHRQSDTRISFGVVYRFGGK